MLITMLLLPILLNRTNYEHVCTLPETLVTMKVGPFVRNEIWHVRDFDHSKIPVNSGVGTRCP